MTNPLGSSEYFPSSQACTFDKLNQNWKYRNRFQELVHCIVWDIDHKPLKY